VDKRKTGFKWIAATCLEVEVPFLTMDEHFDHVHGLQIINWMSK
jgi:predicted nucleic acid-binding protein